MRIMVSKSQLGSHGRN